MHLKLSNIFHCARRTAQGLPVLTADVQMHHMHDEHGGTVQKLSMHKRHGGRSVPVRCDRQAGALEALCNVAGCNCQVGTSGRGAAISVLCLEVWADALESLAESIQQSYSIQASRSAQTQQRSMCSVVRFSM